MDKRKWYNKTILDVPIGFVLVASCTFLLGTYLKNVLKYGRADILAVVVVGGCILLACLFMAMLVRMAYRSYTRKTLVLTVAFFVALVFMAYVLVETILPFFGLQLRKEHVPFSWKEFLSKLFNALFTIVMAGIGYGFYFGKTISDARRNELEKARIFKDKLFSDTRTLLLLHVSQSHYAKHVMSDLVAHCVSVGDRYMAEQVAHIGKTFDYVASVAQQHMPIVSIHRALDYFHQVADAIRRRRAKGDGTVIVEMLGQPTMQVIGPLTLTTLLENSDTHGLVDTTHPIRASFAFSRGRMEFRCSNAKHGQGRTRPTSGQGLSLVEHELSLLARHEVSLDIDEDEETYTICLTINYH